MRDSKENIMVWKHIEEDLEKKIFLDVITADMKFPSYADISKQYNVNRNTSLKICKSLESKNIIYRKIGLGFFLKPGAKEKIKEQQIQKIEDILKKLKSEASFFKINKDDFVKLIDKYMDK